MKVLLIAHNSSVEGSGIAFVHICRTFSSMGVNVIAVVPGEKGVAELIENIPNVKIEIIHQIKNEVYPPFKTLYDKLIFLPKFIRQLYFRKIFSNKLENIIQKELPDLIHSNTGTLRVPSFLAEKYDIPHIWHVREFQTIGCNFKPFGGEKRVRELFSKKNNHCIFITNGVAQYYRYSQQKDIIIYDGVFSMEVVKTLKNNKPDKKNVILFVGLISERKGVPMLLDAFERISNKIPQYELWLVGKDTINIKNKILRLKCSHKIKYLGFREDVYRLMAESRLLVVPSDYEGFGFITAEAMLNHTLVVGRNSAGTKEQMDNAKHMKGRDLALRFNTVEELGEAILIGTNMAKSDYDRLTDDAFDVVTTLYTTERNANLILEYYNRIISY